MAIDAIAQQLKRDFMHRMGKDCSCAVCGDNTRPLAFHMLEKSYSLSANTQKGFVAMSLSRGSQRGAFPVCNQCAPACSRCALPIQTEKILEFGKYVGANVGNGVCRHMHLFEFMRAIFKRTFRIGRFKAT